jgi:hypothetical protein
MAERLNQLLSMTELIAIRRFALPDECFFVPGSNYYTGVATVEVTACETFLFDRTGALTIRRLDSKHSSILCYLFFILLFGHSVT